MSLAIINLVAYLEHSRIACFTFATSLNWTAFTDTFFLQKPEYQARMITKARATATEDDKMGKILSLGPKLKYPITISKLLRKSGDSIKKQQPILQFKFTWMKTVGDPFGEEWEEKQTTIVDWDSPADGKIKAWKIHEGMVISKDMQFVEIVEDCSHDIQYQGLCGMCGKDMTEVTWASSTDDTNRAQINMIHDQTSLKVSENEASRAEGELQRRLLQHRKLSLVVDLDQTIIHACIEPTIGEWQKDPTSPNYEAVKDVRSFQLTDDGVRGLASGCWYYIKMRPGLREFLSKVAEMYELHVYTMGTRAYAKHIAEIVDPGKKLFGDRIISRDENGSITSKNLARLFPVDTKMVVIIDDRADVWPKNRANLIKVVPYDFFLGIGDINSSFLPKREELPKMLPPPKKKQSSKDGEQTVEPEKVETPVGEAEVEDKPTNEVKQTSENDKDDAKVSALEEFVRMGGGDDQALRLEQAAEQEKFLAKQLQERPLLHLQEQLDKEEDVDEAATEEANGTSTQLHPHHRHNLLKDDDTELIYLEKHLTQLHKAFYDEYDGALVSAHGGRVAQLKPGHNKKLSLKTDTADLKIVPDIGHVMPKIKAKTLAGCTLVLSGLIPLQAEIMRYFNEIYLQSKFEAEFNRYLFLNDVDRVLRTEIGIQADSFGAKIQKKVNRHVTHLVASTNRTRTHKVRQAAKYPHIKIVNQQWLMNCISKWEKEPEEPYLVQIHEQDRVREDGFNSSAPSSVNDSDESSDESESEHEDSNSVPASQEEEADDEEGVMPDDIGEGHSPVDDLKEFDWGEVDDELKEFLGSDSENDSDASDASDTSRTSRGSNKSARREKRKHDDITEDDDDSDEESTLAKKQRIAASRSSGLQNVKTPNSSLSESSLPTPGVTDGDQEEEDDDDGFDDDLEADLMAEFEKEFEDDEGGGDG